MKDTLRRVMGGCLSEIMAVDTCFADDVQAFARLSLHSGTKWCLQEGSDVLHRFAKQHSECLPLILCPMPPTRIGRFCRPGRVLPDPAGPGTQ